MNNTLAVKRLFWGLLILLFSSNAFSKRSKPIGYVLNLTGTVRLLRVPGQNARRGVRVKFENQDFMELKIKKYSKLFDNDIVQTFAKSKVKLLLNKTQMVFVGPFSNLIVSAEKKTKDSTIISLFYGKMRSLVNKGKRQNFKVVSPTASMGVRGTDFLVTHSPISESTHLTTIKGQVDVARIKSPPKKITMTKPQEIPPEALSKVVPVKAGFSTQVKEVIPKPSAPMAPPPPPPMPVPAPIEELISAAKVSLIAALPSSEEEQQEIAAMPEEDKKEVEQAKENEKTFLKEFTGKSEKELTKTVSSISAVNADLKKLIKKTVKQTPGSSVGADTSQFIESFLNDRIREEF